MREWSRAVVVLLTTALAVLFGVGCLLAALFELQGFGGPRDQGPRPLYLASLLLGLVVCIAAPFTLRRAHDQIAARIFPESSKGDLTVRSEGRSGTAPFNEQ